MRVGEVRIQRVLFLSNLKVEPWHVDIACFVLYSSFALCTAQSTLLLSGYKIKEVLKN